MVIKNRNNSEIKNYKLVLLGESGVGKTSISNRLVNKSFDGFQESTIGAAFLTKQMDIEEQKIRFEIWDTAGQERYHSLAPMYYRGARCCVIVYDITNIRSFECAKKWVNEIQYSGISNCLKVLIGNKSDLDTRRQISFEEAKRYADDNELLFSETSAKSNDNVETIFYNIGKKLIDMYYEDVTYTNGHLRIENDTYINFKNKKSCCR